MPDYTLWLQARGVGKESPVKDEKWIHDIFELAVTVAAIPASRVDERRQCYREVFLLLDGQRRKLSKRAKAINLRLPLKKFHKVEDVLSMRKWVSEQEERYLHAKRIAKGFWLCGLSIPKFERPYQVEQLLELEKLFKRKGGLYREVQALTRQYKALSHPVPKWTRPYVPEEVETAKQYLAAIKQQQERGRLSNPNEHSEARQFINQKSDPVAKFVEIQKVFENEVIHFDEHFTPIMEQFRLSNSNEHPEARKFINQTKVFNSYRGFTAPTYQMVEGPVNQYVGLREATEEVEEHYKNNALKKQRQRQSYSSFHYQRSAGQQGKIVRVEGSGHGVTLNYLIQAQRFPIRLSLEILLYVAEALQDAHHNQFVHGQLRLHDIMLTTEGTILLDGFGQSEYNPTLPEQIAVGPPSDVYCFGVLMLALLSQDEHFHPPTTAKEHEVSIVERMLHVNWQELEGQPWLEQIQEFFITTMIREPNNRPSLIDVIKVISQIIPLTKDVSLQAWIAEYQHLFHDPATNPPQNLPALDQNIVRALQDWNRKVKGDWNQSKNRKQLKGWLLDIIPPTERGWLKRFLFVSFDESLLKIMHQHDSIKLTQKHNELTKNYNAEFAQRCISLWSAGLQQT